MPWVSLITPQENRTFDSSLGDWVGDAIWEAGPVGGYTGVAQFLMTPAYTPKKMTLSYPHVSALPNKTNTLSFEIIAQVDGEARKCNWKFTDGTHAFQGSKIIEVWNYHELVEAALDIPAGWNITNTSLEVGFEGEMFDFAILCCDNFSLYAYLAEHKPQYLPLMGIG